MRCIDCRGARAPTPGSISSTPRCPWLARLEQRNARLPKYNFWIGPDSMEAFVGFFEIPSNDEGADLIVVRDLGIQSIAR